MIFVTVGTHEQSFDRLVKYMDQWASEHDEEVVIQIGYSNYEPKHAKWQRLFAYAEMEDYMDKARLVITHGGPSSFVAPLQRGKVPIVVPRKKAFDEHVNDHQVDFCNHVVKRNRNIIVIEDIAGLDDTIEQYDEIVAGLRKNVTSNNELFCEKFEKIVEKLVK